MNLLILSFLCFFSNLSGCFDGRDNAVSTSEKPVLIHFSHEEKKVVKIFLESKEHFYEGITKFSPFVPTYFFILEGNLVSISCSGKQVKIEKNGEAVVLDYKSSFEECIALIQKCARRKL